MDYVLLMTVLHCRYNLNRGQGKKGGMDTAASHTCTLGDIFGEQSEPLSRDELILENFSTHVNWN